MLLREDVVDLIRKRDFHERTPLHLACFKNHANIVSLLIKAGDRYIVYMRVCFA